MLTRYAYATDDPDILDAYRASRVARHQFSKKLLPAAAKLGHNAGPLVAKKGSSGREEIIGLKPDGTGKAPAGWHLVNRGKRLAPAVGRAGDQARRWLVEHQPPAGTDPLAVMLEHGLVELSRVEVGGSFTDFRPALFEWDGKLWACYKGQPITDNGTPAEVTWPAVPTEDCLVALARAEAATTAHLN
jgi:hypothetical protein